MREDEHVVSERGKSYLGVSKETVELTVRPTGHSVGTVQAHVHDRRRGDSSSLCFSSLVVGKCKQNSKQLEGEEGR